MIKFLLNGIPVNSEMLAVDAIREVGIGKNFLGHISTLNHMESQSRPELIDRKMRERWTAAGGTDVYQRSQEEARHILETHKPDPLPDGAAAAMRAIIEEAEEELGVVSPPAK
jgi:trimethylamine--corrinoid protein Co-methyltransferase